MLKIILVLIGSVVILPAAVFMLSLTNNTFDVSDAQYVSAQVDDWQPAKRPAARPAAIPVVVPKIVVPEPAPTLVVAQNDAGTMRADTSAVLRNLGALGAQADEPAADTAQASDYTTRELQALIARVMAGSSEDAYVNSLNAEAFGDAQNSHTSINTVLSNIVNASYGRKLALNPSDKAYVDILNGVSAPPIHVTEAIIYKVQPGDNLAKISYIHYGRTEDYVVIFRANRKILDDPNDIIVGQKLTIPAH